MTVVGAIEPLMTLKEVAATLRCHDDNVRNLPGLRGWVKRGRRWFLPPEFLRAYIASHTVE